MNPTIYQIYYDFLVNLMVLYRDDQLCFRMGFMEGTIIPNKHDHRIIFESNKLLLKYATI